MTQTQTTDYAKLSATFRTYALTRNDSVALDYLAQLPERATLTATDELLPSGALRLEWRRPRSATNFARFFGLGRPLRELLIRNFPSTRNEEQEPSEPSSVTAFPKQACSGASESGPDGSPDPLPENDPLRSLGL